MDAATAAIIAAGVSSTVTGLVALGVGWLNPHTTAKRARETELLKMRRDTYVTALQLASSVGDLVSDPEELLQTSRKMRQLVPQLALLGNEELANQYSELVDLAGKLAKNQRELKESGEVVVNFVIGLAEFTSKTRSHIGVDELDR